jgi:ABC-type branched-subunit amino acid transport system substrate-binding protein
MLLLHIFIKSLIPLILAGLNPGEIKSAKQTREQVNTIKIGLLIPNNKSLAARQGAELAIRIANEKNGPDRKHFSLIVKSMEGPWGTGSKQAISLIFDEKISALMASCDGRNAHLIEQAATKSRVVFLSAWSGDPTLSQAFVPWFFNCVPNYNQQADAFIEEIYNKRKLGKIAVISDNDYDSELARDCFIKRSLQAGKPQPLKLLPEMFKKEGIDGLIIFGNAKLKTINTTIPVFGNLAFADEEKISENDFGNVILISPEGIERPEASAFRKEYQKSFGTIPGIVAKLAFDGMNLLIQATANGTDRESIQKALLKIKSEGVTGTIKFDEKGNRIGNLYMIQLINGVPVPVEK